MGMRRLPALVLCALGLALVGCGSSSGDSIQTVMPSQGNGDAPPSDNSADNGGSGSDTGSTSSGGADPGAPNSGSFASTGTVLGQAMSGVGNATILQLDDSGNPSSILVSFASNGLSCGFAQSHAATFNAVPSERVVTLSVQKTGLAPDTFQIGDGGSDGPNVDMHAGVLDSTCQSAMDGSNQTDATNGTVTIKTLTNALVEGSFDVRFANGDHVTGTFSSNVCNLDNAVGDDTGVCVSAM
jgi:hypothetical protein